MADAARDGADRTFIDRIGQGSVAWLPARATLEAKNVARGGRNIPEVWRLDGDGSIGIRFHTDGQSSWENSCFKHPILILSRPPLFQCDDTWVDFLLMTTFRGRDVYQHWPDQSINFYTNWFPSSRELYHPYPHVPRLQFVSGLPLDKPGYVRVDKVYTMRLSDVERYYGNHPESRRFWDLTPESLDDVKAAVQFRTQNQYWPPEEQYQIPVPLQLNPAAAPFVPLNQAPPLSEAQAEAALGDQEDTDEGYRSQDD